MTEPRRRIVDMAADKAADKEVDDVPIRRLAAPTSDDYARALIALVYLARDLLGDAERLASDAAPHIAADNCAEALRHLRSAEHLFLHRTHNREPGSTSQSFERAIHTSEAAVAQIKVFRNYAVLTRSDYEQKQLDHYRGVWRRAARAAKQEAHRVLARLVELFPDAYDDTEGDP